MRKINEMKEEYRLNGVVITPEMFHKIRVEGSYERITTYIHNGIRILNIDGELGVYGSLRGGRR